MNAHMTFFVRTSEGWILFSLCWSIWQQISIDVWAWSFLLVNKVKIVTSFSNCFKPFASVIS